MFVLAEFLPYLGGRETLELRRELRDTLLWLIDFDVAEEIFSEQGYGVVYASARADAVMETIRGHGDMDALMDLRSDEVDGEGGWRLGMRFARGFAFRVQHMEDGLAAEGREDGGDPEAMSEN